MGLKHNFRELKVWQKGMELVKVVYQATASIPKDEVFGLRQQIRRASVSIPSNIAEGCGRNTDPQLLRHLDIAQGSACELETQCILALDLGFIPKASWLVVEEKIHEVQKMIQGFKNSLQ